MIEDITMPDEIGELLQSAEFKLELENMLQIMDPICKLINSCQDPTKNLADAVDKWLRLTLPTDQFDALIQERITHAVNAVGLAAYLMHPRYKGEMINDLQRDIAMNFLIDQLDEEGNNELQDFFENRDDALLQWEDLCKDVYAYWLQHKYLYPKLSKLCLQLMVIPASTSLLESLFSQWAYVHNKYRNRLKHENSSLLVDLYYMSKHWKNGVWQDRFKQPKRRRDSE